MIRLVDASTRMSSTPFLVFRDPWIVRRFLAATVSKRGKRPTPIFHGQKWPISSRRSMTADYPPIAPSRALIDRPYRGSLLSNHLLQATRLRHAPSLEMSSCSAPDESRRGLIPG